MLDLRRLRLLRELEVRGTIGAVAPRAGLHARRRSPSSSRRSSARPACRCCAAPGATCVLTDAAQVLVGHAERCSPASRRPRPTWRQPPGRWPARCASRRSRRRRCTSWRPRWRPWPPRTPRSASRSPRPSVEEALTGARGWAPSTSLVGDEYPGLPRPRPPRLRREPLLTEEVRLILPAGAPASRGAGGVPLAALRDAPWAAGPARHGPPRDARARLPRARRLRARPAPPLQRPADPARARALGRRA